MKFIVMLLAYLSIMSMEILAASLIGGQKGVQLMNVIRNSRYYRELKTKLYFFVQSPINVKEFNGFSILLLAGSTGRSRGTGRRSYFGPHYILGYFSSHEKVVSAVVFWPPLCSIIILEKHKTSLIFITFVSCVLFKPSWQIFLKKHNCNWFSK